MKNNAKKRHLEEAVLNVVSAIDKPLTPLGSARSDFLERYSKTSAKEKNQYRKKIIDAKLSNVIDAGVEVLDKNYSLSAIGGEKFLPEMEALGLTIKKF